MYQVRPGAHVQSLRNQSQGHCCVLQQSPRISSSPGSPLRRLAAEHMAKEFVPPIQPASGLAE